MILHGWRIPCCERRSSLPDPFPAPEKGFQLASGWPYSVPESRQNLWVFISCRMYVHLCTSSEGLARELAACDLQPRQVSEDSHGHRLSLEEFIRERIQIFDRHALDFGDQFVEIVEAVEIHFLARQIRHACSARFKR